MERACEAVAGLKPDLARMPEKLQELYGAPAGSVTLLSANIADVTGAVFRPSSASGKIVPVLPLKPAFSRTLEMPLRCAPFHDLYQSSAIGGGVDIEHHAHG